MNIGLPEVSGALVRTVCCVLTQQALSRCRCRPPTDGHPAPNRDGPFGITTFPATVTEVARYAAGLNSGRAPRRGMQYTLIDIDAVAAVLRREQQLGVEAIGKRFEFCAPGRAW